MSFIEEMYEKHKVLTIIACVLLFPIVIALFVLKIMSSANVAGAEKSLKTAQKTDDQLSAQEDALKDQAAQSLADADKAAQRRNNRAEDNATDLDWQNKRKD
jgi:uncharacterized protein YoxC